MFQNIISKIKKITKQIVIINNEGGIVFIESLNSGTMIEFDIKKFSEIHKAIALKKTGFKDGPFELQYAKRNYKDF